VTLIASLDAGDVRKLKALPRIQPRFLVVHSRYTVELSYEHFAG
jgi:hypothetical protein